MAFNFPALAEIDADLRNAQARIDRISAHYKRAGEQLGVRFMADLVGFNQYTTRNVRLQRRMARELQRVLEKN
jgi:hypothetical protein